MNSINLVIRNLDKEPDDYLLQQDVFPGEIKGVHIELFEIRGDKYISEKGSGGHYDVLFILEGEIILEAAQGKFASGYNYITRIPYNRDYLIYPAGKGKAHFLRIRKYLDEQDRKIISQNKNEHSILYNKSLSDCPLYLEDIHTNKGRNRMILTEGRVPRFCMGTVDAEGPYLVSEHAHPMLDQLFLGLKDCKGIVTADDDKSIIAENMFLHIPLGSKHYVTVDEGDRLFYIWMDFFFDIEGQKYMNEQHQVLED